MYKTKFKGFLPLLEADDGLNVVGGTGEEVLGKEGSECPRHHFDCEGCGGTG